MQDPVSATIHGGLKPQFPAPEEEKQQLKCPRCESTNTKFCYYNNYNLSQPRHFCKDCRRYWTKGGALRNIPVGGGSRKNSKRSSSSPAAANPKRPSTSSSAPSSDSPNLSPIPIPKSEPISVMFPPIDPDDRMLEITGSFSSLLASTGNFGSLLETFHSSDSGVGGFPASSDLNRSIGAPVLELQSSNDSNGSENPTPQPENFLGLQGDSSCWATGWPDLAIYTPGSSFQ